MSKVSPDARIVGNIDTANPEDLLENGEDAHYLLTGEVEVKPPSLEVIAASRNLARLLIEQSPLALSKVIAHYAEVGGLAPTTSNAMVSLLENKVMDASPDQLNDLVSEAKHHGVWPFIKPMVQARNEHVAKQLEEYTNVSALDMVLEQMATTSSQWIPAPVYEKAVTVLRQLAKDANIVKLDEIVNVASKWRMKPKVMSQVIARNRALVDALAIHDCGVGYPMRREHESLLVTSAFRALRMEASGYVFTHKRE
jgi:hypothetical protein